MDAKQLGLFIAERRKELGMTQAVLAEKLLRDSNLADVPGKKQKYSCFSHIQFGLCFDIPHPSVF